VSAGCNGGPSTAKPGSPLQLILGSGTVAAIIGELAGFFSPASVLFDGLALEVGTLCGSDPPPMPVWDANDALIVALGQQSPFYQQTVEKMDALFRNWAWDKVCVCTSNPSPPPLVITAPPPGVGSNNPTTNQPCFTGNYSGTPPINPDSTLQNDLDISATTLSRDGRTRTGDDHSSSGIIYGIPAGTTSITWTGYQPKTASGAGADGQFSFALWTFSSTGVANVPISIGPLNSSVAGQYTGSAPIPSTSSYWLMIARQDVPDANPAIEQPRLQTEVWCGGSVPNGQEACCPPDPSISLALNTIINQLNELLTPSAKAYKKGATHLGLTGTGSLTVAGLFGVQLELTTGVPTAIQFPGVPPYERSVGWCSVLTGDGMIDETRITRQHQVWASALAPYATTIGYQLNAGFTLNVTELLPL
jgi:hypothetical protein